MRSLLAVDGSGLLKRAWWGGRCEHVEQAADLALGILRKTLRTYQPSHLVVALDSPAPTWRHELYPAYKATRSDRGAPSTFDLTEAFKPLLDGSGIAHAQCAGQEADDVLATLTARCMVAGTPILILSRDTDLLQCADYAVVLWPEKDGERRMDAKATFERQGVWPHQIAQLKALAGDVSDNIPRLGAPRQTKGGERFYGFTSKRAAELLTLFGDLESILYAAGRRNGIQDREREWLKAGEGTCRLNLRLATLVFDLALDLDPRATRLANRPPA